MDRNQNQDGRQRKTMQCAHEKVAGGTSYLTVQHRQLQDEDATAPLKTMVAAMTLLPPVAPWPRVDLCLCLTRGVEGWEARAEVREHFARGCLCADAADGSTEPAVARHPASTPVYVCAQGGRKGNL